jgi:hypothetical protein
MTILFRGKKKDTNAMASGCVFFPMCLSVGRMCLGVFSENKVQVALFTAHVIKVCSVGPGLAECNQSGPPNIYFHSLFILHGFREAHCIGAEMSSCLEADPSSRMLRGFH